MNKLLTVALLLVLPYFLSAQDISKWGKHSYIWNYTEIDIRSDLGLSNTIHLKSILSGEDKLSTLASIDGQLIDHAYLEGKIVLIDFWYIRCPPCRRELPALSELSKLYPGKEVVILSICRDNAESIREFGLDHSADNVHIIANAEVRLTNDMVFNYPFKALLNSDGDLLYSFLGGKRTDTPVADMVADMSEKINHLRNSMALVP